MRLFYSELEERSGGETVRALLARAYFEMYGEKLPLLAKTEQGKPYLPERPDVFISLSHTKTHVLVAIGECPVGADAETVREVRRGVFERISTEKEREKFGFFELWTLKESYFKLFGEAPSMRETEFDREGGEIAAPSPDVRARLYDDIPGCMAAVCVRGSALPERAEKI